MATTTVTTPIFNEPHYHRLNLRSWRKQTVELNRPDHGPTRPSCVHHDYQVSNTTIMCPTRPSRPSAVQDDHHDHHDHQVSITTIITISCPPRPPVNSPG